MAISAVRAIDDEGVVNPEGRVVIADRGLEVLADRADSLVGCLEGSSEEAELERLADVLEHSEG